MQDDPVYQPLLKTKEAKDTFYSARKDAQDVTNESDTVKQVINLLDQHQTTGGYNLE